MSEESHPHSGGVAALALGSLGVVFGDIGTSPLYTLQECLGPHGAPADQAANVLGIISLIFWSLCAVVTFKYVAVLMNADNQGEGGIMALLALVPAPLRTAHRGRIGLVALLVMAGASLLFGDGIITPAVSVLSALEGLSLVSPDLAHYSVIGTCLILVLLFGIQSRGTGKLGSLFGPVMLLWFLTIGVIGLINIRANPGVIWALLPTYGARFLLTHGARSLHLLGSVVLAVTGGEALYADMGHFGKSPIRWAWMGVVFPALTLCYLGQGALVLNSPAVAEQPFFSLVPAGPIAMALVILAAAATVIASQGLISAVFSLTHQAIRLGYFPRVEVRHTSSEMEGQIYVPAMNWGLALSCVGLVLIFQTSSRLAAAYGLAVSGTMALTSVVLFFVTRYSWDWSLPKSLGLLALFLSFDLPFLAGTCLKFFEGGYIPFGVGFIFFVVMTTWCAGRSLLREYYWEQSVPLENTIAQLDKPGFHRIPGMGVFMASSAAGAPPVLLQMVRRFRVCHEKAFLVTVTSESVPTVDPSQRVEVTELGHGFYRVLLHYGFSEMTTVPDGLREALKLAGLPEDTEPTYIVGHETFAATDRGRMSGFRESIFAFLARNAAEVTSFFWLPIEEVVELGDRIDL